MRTGLRYGSILGAVIGLGGCATPCVDDGLNQKYCGADTDSATDTDASTDSATDSGTGDATDSASDSATTETDTMNSAGGTGAQCPLLDLNLTSENPTIVFLLDRSGSMGSNFSNGLSRWEAVRATLFDPADGVVTQLENEIRFGLSMYDGGDSCPTLIDEAPKLNNAMDMAATFDATGGPGSGTPTGESLSAAATVVAADMDQGTKRIVLATDGEPNTCADPGSPTGQPDAVMAAGESYTLGVPVSVISVGSGVSAMHLQDLANAGAGVVAGDPDAPYYQALDQASLLAAFNEILAAPRDCRLFLSDPLIEAMASMCTVTVNGTVVPLDGTDGWSVNTPMQIELNGAACTSIQEGVVDIGMECQCSAVGG
jgi:Mg-chelatase subunit ChlD